MEILNIFYNNNFIAYYLIGAILVVILILIILSSMTTSPKETKKDKEKILQDPIENEEIINIQEKIEKPLKEEIKDIPKINDIVEDLYQQKLNEEPIKVDETQDLNSFLEEFDVPNYVIEEVTNNDIEIPQVIEERKEENPIIETTEENVKIDNNIENIESMLKRLYDLRQDESNAKKSALLNEIYDLKKQVDEKLKSNNYDYSLDYNNVDTKALADYYLFNEDIEFPKLK